MVFLSHNCNVSHGHYEDLWTSRLVREVSSVLRSLFSPSTTQFCAAVRMTHRVLATLWYFRAQRNVHHVWGGISRVSIQGPHPLKAPFEGRLRHSGVTRPSNFKGPFKRILRFPCNEGSNGWIPGHPTDLSHDSLCARGESRWGKKAAGQKNKSSVEHTVSFLSGPAWS